MLKVLLAIPSILTLNIIVYRLFLKRCPLHIGDCEINSPAEFTYNVYVLFYLLFFNPMLPTLLVPLPLMRIIYLFLGAKLGNNTYSAGVILDPPLVQVGSNTILGFDSVLCPHAVEGDKIHFSPIKIGDNVTIGMRSIIMAGCVIEDHCLVAAGSIVTKGSYLKKGEVWAGTPAKKMREKNGERVKHEQI
jgi:acetyltransferase-like isoleucine patch superfamily enzyme